MIKKYEVVIKGKLLGTIEWQDSVWKLLNLPTDIKSKLTKEKVWFPHSVEKHDVSITMSEAISTKNPFWAYRLALQLASKESEIDLIPVTAKNIKKKDPV